MTNREVTATIEGLFARARAADECDYALSILRVRGMEDAGWDPLMETHALFRDVATLLQTPLNDLARLRLGLLLYSHLTEVDAIYDMIANLVAVSAGERCSISPFNDLYVPKGKPRYAQRPPSAKAVVMRLKKLATDAGAAEVVELLEWFFNDAVRNAFFHSDYILFEGEFRSRDGLFVQADGTRTPSLALEHVADLINRAMLFFQVFVSVLEKQRRSYRTNKQIEGRLGGDGSVIPVTLLADRRRGLYGLQG